MRDLSHEDHVYLRILSILDRLDERVTKLEGDARDCFSTFGEIEQLREYLNLEDDENEIEE
ncbi:hypothetical protein ACI2JA_03635 [Alkalihalobacillus sp. NPDC078783]